MTYSTGQKPASLSVFLLQIKYFELGEYDVLQAVLTLYRTENHEEDKLAILCKTERLLKPNKSFRSVCHSYPSSVKCIATVYSYINISVMLDGRFDSMAHCKMWCFQENSMIYVKKMSQLFPPNSRFSRRNSII